MRRFALARMVAWIVLTPIAYYERWVYSVAFVSVLSLWALVEASYNGWRADVPIDG